MSLSVSPVRTGVRPPSAPLALPAARQLPAVIDLRDPADGRRRQPPPGLRLPRGRGGARNVDRLGLLLDEYA